MAAALALTLTVGGVLLGSIGSMVVMVVSTALALTLTVGSVLVSSIGGVLVLTAATVTTILLVVTVALTVLAGTSLASVLAAVILLVVARAVIVLVTALAGVRGVLATGTRALGVTSGVEAVRLGRGVLASLVQGLVDGVHADLLSRVDGHGAGLQAHVHLVDAVNGRDLLGCLLYTSPSPRDS